MGDIKGKIGEMLRVNEQNKEEQNEKKEAENTGDGTEIIKKLMQHDQDRY